MPLFTLAIVLLATSVSQPPMDAGARSVTPAEPPVPAASQGSDASFFTTDKPQEVASGYKFTEGPTWVPGEGSNPGFFVFCDMAGDTVYRWDGGSDKPIALLNPSGRCVGSTSDRKGAVYHVETAGRRIVTWSMKDGKPTAPVEVAAQIEGKKLGGLNDCALHSNGSLYVTSGTWFLRGEKVDFEGVIRVKADKSVEKVVEGHKGPNGICFSPDGKAAYLTEYSSQRIYKYTVKEDGTFGEKLLFADLKEMAKSRGIKDSGGADGLRCDNKGNVYSTGPGGIWVLDSNGAFAGHLAQRGTNLCFGGEDGKTMLITTGSGVVKIGTKNAGAGW